MGRSNCFSVCAARCTSRGSEHIPSQGGVVLVSNHISAFDTVLLPYSVLATQGMQIIWAPAKAELFRSRLLGYLLTPWEYSLCGVGSMIDKRCGG